MPILGAVPAAGPGRLLLLLIFVLCNVQSQTANSTAVFVTPSPAVTAPFQPSPPPPPPSPAPPSPPLQPPPQTDIESCGTAITFASTTAGRMLNDCERWCSGHADSWLIKCAWPQCNRCSECFQSPPPPQRERGPRRRAFFEGGVVDSPPPAPAGTGALTALSAAGSNMVGSGEPYWARLIDGTVGSLGRTGSAGGYLAVQVHLSCITSVIVFPEGVYVGSNEVSGSYSVWVSYTPGASHPSNATQCTCSSSPTSER